MARKNATVTVIKDGVKRKISANPFMVSAFEKRGYKITSPDPITPPVEAKPAKAKKQKPVEHENDAENVGSDE